MLAPELPAIYAVTVRGRKPIGRRPLLDSWFYPLTIGQPLPSLPIWLDADRGVPLDLGKMVSVLFPGKMN